MILQAIIENSSAFIYIKNKEGRYTVLSKSLLSLAGLNESYQMKHCTEILPFLHTEPIIANDKKVLETGLSLNTEERFRLHNREYILHTQKIPIQDQNGKVVSVCSISHEVTGFKTTEESIKKIFSSIYHKHNAAFFTSLVKSLSETIHSDYTYIGKVNSEITNIETLALYHRGAIIPNIQYELKNTPCESVISKKNYLYTEQLPENFSELLFHANTDLSAYIGVPLINSKNSVIGILIALYKNPLASHTYIHELLTIFSISISTEI